VQGKAASVTARNLEAGGADPSAAVYGEQVVFVDGRDQTAKVYDRAKLRAGNRIAGPAIVTEMDSTTLILTEHVGVVDNFGNILIRPSASS
jgi:N-methylhydantoinase A